MKNAKPAHLVVFCLTLLHLGGCWLASEDNDEESNDDVEEEPTPQMHCADDGYHLEIEFDGHTEVLNCAQECLDAGYNAFHSCDWREPRCLCDDLASDTECAGDHLIYVLYDPEEYDTDESIWVATPCGVGRWCGWRRFPYADHMTFGCHG